MSVLIHESDYWKPQRERMRVLLELLEEIADADACPRADCPGMVDVRAAFATIGRYIDAMPVDCECHSG